MPNASPTQWGKETLRYKICSKREDPGNEVGEHGDVIVSPANFMGHELLEYGNLVITAPVFWPKQKLTQWF